ncbi:fungal-specific transcription factor domain-containing protein [Mycena amicta]|nr:fungal-specific transcription factor domain-containing protein [Mycena amicta]
MHSSSENIEEKGRSHTPSGACVHCKSLKVRCELLPNQAICKRCHAGNYECIPRSRKKRKQAPTHEDLQTRAHQQDRQIEALLAKWDQMRISTKMHQLTADGPINLTPATSPSPEAATISYFSRGRTMWSRAPEIVRGCSLYPTEILELFNIYFQQINPYFCILDPALYSDPCDVMWSSPFLFTVICATASRFYNLRPGLYSKAHDLARDAAATSLIDGSIGVDVCQAYLILAVYPTPKKKWADDRSWLFIGIAVRMAIELKLDQPPGPVHDERESLNRTRTWLFCFCVDTFHTIQQGKLPMLHGDHMARQSRDWYQSSTLEFDVYVCAGVDLLLSAAEWQVNYCRGGNSFILHPGSRENFERDGILERNLQAASWPEYDANTHLSSEAHTGVFRISVCCLQPDLLCSISAYLRLAILADGFQCAPKEALSRDAEIVRRSIAAAQEVIQITLDKSWPHLRFAMDGHFLHIAFAAAFLINLLRPRFLHLLYEETRQEIVALVKRLCSLLGCEHVALNARDAPAQVLSISLVSSLKTQ